MFYLNFYVFSVFAALLATEIMGGVILILWWNRYRRAVLEYIIPVWEVTGTFGAFWVVLSDFAFPDILIPLAGLYAAAIMIFLIFFVARNSSIAFGEFIIKKGWLDERKLYTAYSLSTVLIGLIVLYILSGIIGGYGVNLSQLNVNLASWIAHPADLLFIIGAVVIMIGLAPVFYGARDMAHKSLIITIAGTVISAVSLYMFKFSGLSALIAVPVILTVMPPVLFMTGRFAAVVSNKLVFLAWLSFDLFSLSFMVYPTAFGGAVSVDSLTATGPMVGAYFAISLVGGIILAVLVAFYAIAVKRKGRTGTTGPP